MAEGWQLTNAHVEAEDRKGYVYVRIRGELRTVAEVDRASTLVLDRLAQAPAAKLLLDVRALKLPLPDDACHAAWQFIHARGYELLACTFPEDSADLMVTRMNMTGLSTGLPFRAFASIVDAHRWLELKPSGIHRRPSAVMPAMTQPGDSDKPPEVRAFRPNRVTGSHSSAATHLATRSTTPPPGSRNGNAKNDE